MAEMFLRRLTRWQAEQQRELFADTYVEAYAGVAGEEFRDRQDFLRRFEEHVQQPDFESVVAASEKLMGYAYGFRVSRSGEWWRGIDQALSSHLEELTASGQVFVLADVTVLSPYRGRHVATRLLNHLLARSVAARAIALVPPGNALALAAFRSWSWTDLGTTDAATDKPELEAWSRLLTH